MSPKLDTRDLSADDAVEAVARFRGTQAELREAHRLEVAHPKKPRKSVLNALEERLGEAGVSEASAGLARAPLTSGTNTPFLPGTPILYTDAKGQTHDAEYRHMLSVCVAKLKDGKGTEVWAVFDPFGGPNTWRHV